MADKSDGKNDEGMAFLLNYYNVPLEYLHRKLDLELRDALLIRPARKMSDRFEALHGGGGKGARALSWEEVFQLAKELESDIGAILKRKSVFFWQHLYRRIAPFLHPDMGGKTDAATLGLVRETVECSISKFGRLDVRKELQLSGSVGVADVFGGYFVRAHEKAIPDSQQRYKLFQGMRAGNEWVIVDFRTVDLIGIYEVEGLAYQYWRLTAMMRAIGKGAGITISETGVVLYDEQLELWRLIDSYDSRATEYSEFDESSLGIWFESQEKASADSILSFAVNAWHRDLGPLFKTLGLEIELLNREGVITNFIPAPLDGASFANAHAYASEAFFAEKGFQLTTLAQSLSVISGNAASLTSDVLKNRFGVSEALGLALYSLCSRAYVLKAEPAMQALREACVELLCKTRDLPVAQARNECDRLFDFLTLSESGRAKIGLWSRGPIYPIVPFENGSIVDLFGIHNLLRTVFVGVRDDFGGRGFVFEDHFRAALVGMGFELLTREFRFLDGSKREADAVLMLNNQLVVVDCLSIWRPLDFEISRPKTMVARQKTLQAKCNASIDRVTKLQANPVGKNFDFSSAKAITAIVVTPFVEWLWSDSTDLWIDEVTPRVMKASEFMAWAEAQRSK